MLCPNCQKEMIVVERNQIELDYCINCNGFWFDNNEWNLLIQKLTQENNYNYDIDLYNIPKAIVKENIKKCPICNTKMDKFIAYDIILDRCPNKHGIWFDKNEISKFINYTNLNNNKTPIKFLGEIFYGN